MNMSPDSQQKESMSQLQWMMSVSQWKIRTKQNPQLSSGSCWVYERKRGRPGATRGAQPGLLRLNTIQCLIRSKTGYAALVVVTQDDPHLFWSRDQNQKKGFVFFFPTHQRTTHFDVVRRRYRRFRSWWSSDSDTKTKLATTCNL